MEYKTTEEIRKAFIADGWNESIDFEETELNAIGKTLKAYRMKNNGNIYSTTGKILVYNIKPCLQVHDGRPKHYEDTPE